MCKNDAVKCMVSSCGHNHADLCYASYESIVYNDVTDLFEVREVQL